VNINQAILLNLDHFLSAYGWSYSGQTKV